MNLKMYIIIKDTCPPNVVPLLACHAVMGTYLKFWEPENLMDQWAKSPSFKKVICIADEKVFEKTKEYGAHCTITENRHTHLGELSVGFDIQKEYPKFFQFLKMYTVGSSSFGTVSGRFSSIDQNFSNRPKGILDSRVKCYPD